MTQQPIAVKVHLLEDTDYAPLIKHNPEQNHTGSDGRWTTLTVKSGRSEATLFVGLAAARRLAAEFGAAAAMLGDDSDCQQLSADPSDINHLDKLGGANEAFIKLGVSQVKVGIYSALALAVAALEAYQSLRGSAPQLLLTHSRGTLEAQLCTQHGDFTFDVDSPCGGELRDYVMQSRHGCLDAEDLAAIANKNGEEEDLISQLGGSDLEPAALARMLVDKLQPTRS